MAVRAKVVVAYLDGRRLKGYSYDFSATREFFHLMSNGEGKTPENGAALHGVKVNLPELKAVFFVKDFVGNRDRRDEEPEVTKRHGRKVEVVFADGEKQRGVTETYFPGKLGFFLFPADTGGNNDHIFVISKNVKGVRFL